MQPSSTVLVHFDVVAASAWYIPVCIDTQLLHVDYYSLRATPALPFARRFPGSWWPADATATGMFSRQRIINALAVNLRSNAGPSQRPARWTGERGGIRRPNLWLRVRCGFAGGCVAPYFRPPALPVSTVQIHYYRCRMNLGNCRLILPAGRLPVFIIDALLH